MIQIRKEVDSAFPDGIPYQPKIDELKIEDNKKKKNTFHIPNIGDSIDGF